MNAPRPLLRGLALKNDLAVVRALHGDALLARFAERLAPAHRADYVSGFLPGRWYDEEIQAALATVLLEQLGEVELARTAVAIVAYHVNRAQRFLARIAGPARLLERSAGLWSYWRDTGRLQIEYRDSTSVTVAVVGNPTFAAPGYTAFYAAASSYLVYLAGARQLMLRTDTRDPLRVRAMLSWGDGSAPSAGSIDVDALVASLPKTLPP